eukprot:scaffold79342_cov29-Tisochrysis_lutea.AAC.2
MLGPYHPGQPWRSRWGQGGQGFGNVPASRVGRTPAHALCSRYGRMPPQEGALALHGHGLSFTCPLRVDDDDIEVQAVGL